MSSNPTRQDEFLTTEETANYLKIAVPTLEGYRVKGIGPSFVKLGRRVVYSRADLDAYAAANKHKSTSSYEHA